MTNQNDFDPKTYRLKLTLPDDSVVELTADQIQEFSQDMGDAQNTYDICGINPLFGPRYCPKCKANGKP